MSPADIDRDLLRAYARIFINRWDVVLHGTAHGGWRCVHQPLTESHLRRAVAGHIGLVAVAATAQGMSRWVCFDLDTLAPASVFAGILDAIVDPAVVLLECSRRGFHLWVFIDPLPWVIARQWAISLANRAGLAEIEVFPKGPGLNGVRLPLSRHPKSGAIYPIVDVTTGELVADPLPFLATRRRLAVHHTIPDPAPIRPPEMITDADDHLELVREIERYTHLRSYAPERAIGRCPLHDDRHPSLGVIGGYWRCFAGCGEGGLNAFRARMREKGGQQ